MISRLTLATILLALAAAPLPLRASAPGEGAAGASELVQRIRGELQGPLTEDSKRHPGVPHGEFLEGVVSNPKAYPGTRTASRYTSRPSIDPPARPAFSCAWTG